MPSRAGDYWRRESEGVYVAEATDGRRFYLELHRAAIGAQHNTWLVLLPPGDWLALNAVTRDDAFRLANRAVQPATLVHQRDRPA